LIHNSQGDTTIIDILDKIFMKLEQFALARKTYLFFFLIIALISNTILFTIALKIHNENAFPLWSMPLLFLISYVPTIIGYVLFVRVYKLSHIRTTFSVINSNAEYKEELRNTLSKSKEFVTETYNTLNSDEHNLISKAKIAFKIKPQLRVIKSSFSDTPYLSILRSIVAVTRPSFFVIYNISIFILIAWFLVTLMLTFWGAAIQQT